MCASYSPSSALICKPHMGLVSRRMRLAERASVASLTALLGRRLPRWFVCLIRALPEGVVPPLFAKEAMSSVEAVSPCVGRCVEDLFDVFSLPSVSPSGYHANPSLWLAICEARNVSAPSPPSGNDCCIPTGGSCGLPQLLRQACCSSRESGKSSPASSATNSRSDVSFGVVPF